MLAGGNNHVFGLLHRDLVKLRAVVLAIHGNSHKAAVGRPIVNAAARIVRQREVFYVHRWAKSLWGQQGLQALRECAHAFIVPRAQRHQRTPAAGKIQVVCLVGLVDDIHGILLLDLHHNAPHCHLAGFNADSVRTIQVIGVQHPSGGGGGAAGQMDPWAFAQVKVILAALAFDVIAQVLPRCTWIVHDQDRCLLSQTDLDACDVITRLQLFHDFLESRHPF